MSAQTAVRVAPSRAPRPSRPATPKVEPRLLLVRAPAHTRTRVPFVVACMAILAASLVAALLLNTTMARGAYEKHDLELQLAQLAGTEQELSAELDQRASPTALAAAARALGMVPAVSTGWITLSDGTVKGGPAAGANE